MNSCENARVATNHVMFQCLNIPWITGKGFEGRVSHDPSNVWTLKTMVDPCINREVEKINL